MDRSLPEDAACVRLADSASSSLAVALREGGERRELKAREGETLLVVLKRAGLSLAAICGGKGVCGTCKVAIAYDWSAQLGEPGKREMQLLTHLKAERGERLSCRITLTRAMSGLEVSACDSQPM